MVGKCHCCGKEFAIKCFKKYYAYKLGEYGSRRMFYFCSYSCMQTAKREHPEKYSKKVVW